MNEKEKEELKEWLKNCPNKKLVRIWNIFLIGISMYAIYNLGYAIGTFLANIGL